MHRVRPMFAIAAMLALQLGASPALARAVTTSPGPEQVAVTIYRDPGRGSDRQMNLAWLNGFALITETRRIAIPEGEADIRFEGVAGGIIPESAIVTGLPDGVIEKNQDAYLLSPASLLDRSLGKRVHLRRTSMATGAVREEEAVIRSGADGAVVLQTRDGFEALRCIGLPETIVYDQVPEGLAAKPTLSVRTRSSQAGNVTVTLSYLASGFDWQANYVASLNPDGDRMDLLGWVTLANGDETSFADAETQTVAGRLNRVEEPRRRRPPERGLQLRCWPSATTSDIPLKELEKQWLMGVMAGFDEDIVVTASRVPAPMIQAAPLELAVVQEELGDLKLYRVPEPVTVASNSQKQVALLQRADVKVESFYRLNVPWYAEAGESLPVGRVLKTRNRKEEGLGLPLPAGGVALFGEGYARPVLIGEGSVGDKAVGEDVEIELGQATGVHARLVRTSGDENEGEYLLTVSNDQKSGIRFDAEFGSSGEAEVKATSRGAKFGRRNGRPLWSVKVPANSALTLSYSVKLAD
jgi:hypothetical protein